MDGQRVGVVIPMYNIRLATEADWPLIAPMCRSFYDFSTYDIPYDEASAKQQFDDIVRGNGEVVIAMLNEEAVGMIAFAVHPFPTNRNVLVGTEILWWVQPEHRGSVVAKELSRTMEAIAKIRYGASYTVMSKLSNSPPLVDRFYKRQGYKDMDTSYMKEL